MNGVWPPPPRAPTATRDTGGSAPLITPGLITHLSCQLIATPNSAREHAWAPEALPPATVRPVATERVASWCCRGCRQMPRVFVCRGAAFVYCLFQPPGLFAIRQSPVLPTDFCLFPSFPPRSLKAAPGGRGSSAKGVRTGSGTPGSATRAAFTNKKIQ